MIILLIFLSYWLGLSFHYYYLFSGIIVSVLFLFLLIKKKKRALILSLSIFLIGLIRPIISLDIDTKETTIIVYESKDNYILGFNGLEKFYIYKKNNDYNVGDVLNIKGQKKKLESNMIESSFDFKDYLEKKGCHYSFESTKVETRFDNPIPIKELKKSFLSHFDQSQLTKDMVKGILFSTLSDDNGDLDNIKALHLTRLLSTSGVYIALFYKLIVGIFSLFLKDKWARLIGIISIGVYNLFLFPKFLVLRFLTYTIFKYINDVFLKKRFDYLTIVSLTGLLFLFLDYNLTYQLSFILGYGFQLINYFIGITFARFKRLKRTLLRVVFLYMFLIPIELYYYHEISLITYLLSFIMTPIFMIYGVLSFISLLGIPLYSLIISFTIGIKNLSYYLSFIALPIYGPPFHQIILSIYYLLIVISLYYWDINYLFFIKLMHLFSVTFVIIQVLPINNLITEEVSFISVGQGDSTLIRKGNTTVLVDTGGLTYLDLAKESLIPFLKKKRIYNIDVVFTTHNDYDHIGALTSLKENFNVKKHIDSPDYFPVEIGGLKFINYNHYFKDNSDENDKSLVIGFNLLSKDFLLMGDASKSIEKEIMSDYTMIPCDILKVGHHGSNTSSSEKWIQYLSPKEAIISCGKNNKYGHPHKEVINYLDKYNVKIHRTDIEGTISYSGLITF